MDIVAKILVGLLAGLIFLLFWVLGGAKFGGWAIVIFLAIFLLAIISFFRKKKFSLFWITAIITTVVIILAIFSGLVETDLGDGGTMIKGNYIEKDGAIYIDGVCVIAKTVYGSCPYASFDVKGNGTAEVVFRDCNPEFGFEDFHSGPVKFNTKGKIQRIVFKTDLNAISVRIGGDFTYLYAIDNAEKFRTREVKLIVKGKDIWLDNFKA